MSASDLTPGEGRSTGWALPLKTMIWGMAEMRYLVAISCASSVLTLATLTLPAKSAAILSMVGASWRHGPHQTAQKSTRMGLSDLTTSCSQLAAVTSTTLA